MNTITLALAKGRLAKKTMTLLEGVGITCEEMESKSRELIFTSDKGDFHFFLRHKMYLPI